MVQVYQAPTIVKVIPRDGELEIKLDITINLATDGLSALAVEPKRKQQDDDVKFIVPDFPSGNTLNFGNKLIKKEK